MHAAALGSTKLPGRTRQVLPCVTTVALETKPEARPAGKACALQKCSLHGSPPSKEEVPLRFLLPRTLEFIFLNKPIFSTSKRNSTITLSPLPFWTCYVTSSCHDSLFWRSWLYYLLNQSLIQGVYTRNNLECVLPRALQNSPRRQANQLQT